MSTVKKRVCIIGAGPSGMAALFRFGQLDPAHAPEVVCYEKQQTWGGLWNFDWRTGKFYFDNVENKIFITKFCLCSISMFIVYITNSLAFVCLSTPVSNRCKRMYTF